MTLYTCQPCSTVKETDEPPTTNPPMFYCPVCEKTTAFALSKIGTLPPTANKPFPVAVSMCLDCGLLHGQGSTHPLPDKCGACGGPIKYAGTLKLTPPESGVASQERTP